MGDDSSVTSAGIFHQFCWASLISLVACASLHFGLGKTFVGSGLALISDRMVSGSVDARFEELTDAVL